MSNMEMINIYGDNRFDTYKHVRPASRGLLLSEGCLLLTHEDNGQYFIPGGGFEGDESAEMCCIREMSEETGYVVRPVRQFLTINEYYEDWLFVSHYFLCEYEGRAERMLTERERQAGVVPAWVPFDRAVAEFARHNEFAATDEMRRGAYLREYTALDCFVSHNTADTKEHQTVRIIGNNKEETT